MTSKRNKVTQNTANMEKRDSDETTSILNAIEQMKQEFLNPIKKSMERLENHVSENTNRIAACEEEITQLKNNVNDYYDEIGKRMKLQNRIYVFNVVNEREVTNLFKDIVGKATDILWMKAFKQPDIHGRTNFMVETSQDSRQKILSKKTEFFKKHPNCRIGVDEALTKKQREAKKIAFDERMLKKNQSRNTITGYL